jgi:hypothetical protein
MLELPSERPLSGTEGTNVPYFYVRDGAFELNRNILRPFCESNLSVKKRVYNYRVCIARKYVECGFGILSNKWKIFHRLLNVSPDFAVVIVKACFVQHNFVRARERDALTVTGIEDVPDGQSIREGLTANNVRNKVAGYFVTDAGAASWQM